MKNYLFIAFFTLLTTMGFSQKNSMDAYKIYNSQGKEVTFAQMTNSLQKADIVFFGELHNNPIAHWLELKVAETLYASKETNFIMGAEMFESDNQLILGEYMKDLITERSFESECRLWPNYKTDYKPIIKFAKQKKIPFIATNIPRRYANIVYRKDFEGLDSLSKEAKKYIAPLPIKYDSSVECYKKMIEGMKGMGNHGSKTIAKAQAIKDATMAYFILQNFKKGDLFFHFNGSYHSDNHQGICWYLTQANKNLRIKTISTVLQNDISKLNKDNKNLADFIICVPEDMTTTY